MRPEVHRRSLSAMEYRNLGGSGLKISQLAYGNWITHAGQVEIDAARECVHAALDAGITTFDTADVYAGTHAEAVLGDLLQGQRRDGLEIFTKVYWPTGPGRNDVGLSRKHILRSCEASLKRLKGLALRRGGPGSQTIPFLFCFFSTRSLRGGPLPGPFLRGKPPTS